MYLYNLSSLTVVSDMYEGLVPEISVIEGSLYPPDDVSSGVFLVSSDMLLYTENGKEVVRSGSHVGVSEDGRYWNVLYSPPILDFSSYLEGLLDEA